MGSIKAQRAAIKVSESIRAGKPITYGKILKEAGYSDSTAESPTLVTETKSFKTALIAANAPLLEGLQQEINRIKNAMAGKNIEHEDYRVLVGSLDLLTKNYQLLSGGATERQVFVLPSQVMARNAITATQANGEGETKELKAPETAQQSDTKNVAQCNFSDVPSQSNPVALDKNPKVLERAGGSIPESIKENIDTRLP